MTREEIAAALARLGECYECGDASEVQMHHVVPKSKGGTMMVPLCLACHGVVHSRKKMAAGALTSAAMRQRMSDGQYIGGRAPYGFSNVNGQLVECPTEQAVIAQARDLRAQGLTLQAVAAELAEQGSLSRTGKVFHHDSIRAMTAPETTPRPTPRATTSGV